MAKLIGEIMFPNGKYNTQEGEKTRWLRCGVLLETDKGFRIKLEALPVGATQVNQSGEPENGLWFMVFEPREKQQDGFRDKPAQAAKKTPEQDDDIPF